MRGLRYAVVGAVIVSMMGLAAPADQVQRRRIPREGKHSPLLKDPSAIRHNAEQNDPTLKRLPELPLRTPTLTEVRVLWNQGSEFRDWRTSLDVNWKLQPADLNLQFRWVTQQPGVNSGLWQASLLPFDPNTKEWQNPPGLVARGPLSEVPAPGKVSFFRVDFSQFAPRPPVGPLVGIDNLAKRPLPGNVGTVPPAPTITAPGGKTIQGRQIPVPGTGAANRPSVSAQRAARGAYFKKAKLGYRQSLAVIAASLDKFKYYVRVVPLGASGKPVGQPSVPVEINYGQQMQAQVEIVQIKYEYITATHPVVTIQEYYPVQFQDSLAMYHVIVTRDPLANIPWIGDSPYYVGQHLDLTPHYGHKSWWDEFCEAIGDFFSFVVDAVNWVANTYQSIKNKLVDFVADAVGDWAKGPLSVGLDVGLAAIGLPPSLPNFDELTDLGKGYFVKEIADTMDLPEDVTKAGLDAFINKARDVANGGDVPYAWFKPDPDYYYRPALVMLNISNPSSSVTERVSLGVLNEGTKYPVYEPAGISVPPLNPGESMTVPLFLKENTGPGYVTSDPASYNWPTKQTWEQEYYYNQKVVFTVGTSLREASPDPSNYLKHWKNFSQEQQKIQLNTKTYYSAK
jgi:hypothetical protein